MLGAQTPPFEMAQKKKKKCVSSHGHENLTNRKAPNKKKSIINTKKSNQIISNGEEEATQKFNKKKKKKSVRPYQISGKSIVELSNDNTDQMEIDQVIRIYLQEEIMMDILSSEDCKILAINLNADHSFDTSIEILSLKSGSWRRIGYPTGIERVTGFRSCGMDYLAFLHGALHWLGMSLSGYYTTVSFNISNEVYGEVPLLEQMYHVFPSFRCIDRGVLVLRGMLCFHSMYNYWEMGIDCTLSCG
ncbi:hypothetical protein MTR67_038349 [Solanum verrucosum]|uniref:Uncharacterized protein n=1 Tax=Solanum verrucosum TaxID=315347 RepID=A0AAF0UFM8_SOLVR|nr:hypothetical protein MTR67_038349 [Solanum verrucosum]